jgi:hypothetical protein
MVQLVYASSREWDGMVSTQVWRPLFEAAFSSYAAQGQLKLQLPTTKVSLISVEHRLEKRLPCRTLVCEIGIAPHYCGIACGWFSCVICMGSLAWGMH